ncbi:hypothetical protein D3C78_36840 [compost metagenome]
MSNNKILKVDHSLFAVKGELLYLKDEYSIFFVEENHIDALTSLVLHTLEIMVAEDGLLSRVQGYFPISSWTEEVLPDFESQQASIYLDESNSDIKKNMGIGQPVTREWPIYYDKGKGIVFVGENINQALNCIEFCTGCYLSICNGYINGLWMRPKIVENFPK